MSYATQVIHMHTCDFCSVSVNSERSAFPEGWTYAWSPAPPGPSDPEQEPLHACRDCSENLLIAFDKASRNPTLDHVHATEPVRAFLRGMEDT